MLKFDQLSRPATYLVAPALMAAIGVADYLSGVELLLSSFYLLPIALVAWAGGRREGLFTAALGAGVWFLADSRHVYSHPIFLYWNAALRLVFFVFVAYTLIELKRSLEREKSLARVDFLTNIPNSKAFYELAGRELERCRRAGLPVTIAYLDCDNFKAVNDSRGHRGGDDLLRAVAQTIMGKIRNVDIGARIGGDEFIIFLPEASAEDAQKAIGRVHEALAEDMRVNRWPVTFSVGAVTFFHLAESLDQMVSRVDNLMYQAKNSGRDRILHEVV